MELDLLKAWGESELSPLATIVSARRARGDVVEDFITANPYDHGFRFSPSILGEILGRATYDAQRYSAEPLGRLAAREAVVRLYGGISPEQVMLTPGTSMAYFYLFRLLAKPGGEVLCPAPTYPLFNDLARISGLKVRRYHLHRTGSDDGTTRWALDPEELQFQVTPRTCAIVLVSPHNPTGTITNHDEMAAACVVAEAAGIPLIMDEVFRTYRRDEGAPVLRPSACGTGLSIVLNGISKSHYLPGMKQGWMVVEGDKDEAGPLMNALEYMSDSFLPVNEIAQTALPDLLSGDAIQEAGRLADLQRERLSWRLQNTSGWPVAVPEAGPYICVPLEHERADDDVVVSQLLTGHGALFHPGNLYDFREPYMVATAYNQAPWPEKSEKVRK